MQRPVASRDLTWLLMDRPNNLMYVHGVLWLESAPDWDALLAVLRERLIDRFSVFRMRAGQVDGEWIWQEDEDFSIDYHVRRVPGPLTLAEVQRHISERFSQVFDPERPLWEIDVIEDVDGGKAMLLARFHHGIADGVRLVQVLISLLDPLAEDVVPAAVGRGGRQSPAGMAVGALKGTVTGASDFVSGLVANSPRTVGRVIAHGRSGLRQPTRVVDSISEVAAEDNVLVNSWRSVSRLTLSGRSVKTVWSGEPGMQKKVSWISGIPLQRVRDISKAHRVTINDVMLGAVSLGVTEYLATRGEVSVDEVSWLVPVSLKPLDAELPEELGNHFAIVMLPMPLGVREPSVLLREMHSRMNRIKNSAEPMILYGVQRVIAETPPAVSVRLTNYVANKTAGIITNVPGPRAPMALAGTEVTGILGWVPTSADQPLGLCIFSYNGSVSIGIAADAGLVPDPDVLAECIRSALDSLTE